MNFWPSFRSHSSLSHNERPRNKLGIKKVLTTLSRKKDSCDPVDGVVPDSYYSKYLSAKKAAELEARVLDWMRSSSNPSNPFPLQTDAASPPDTGCSRIADTIHADSTLAPLGPQGVNQDHGRRYICRRRHGKPSQLSFHHTGNYNTQEISRIDIGAKSSATSSDEILPGHGAGRSSSSGRWRPLASHLSTPST
jgi:hypothetical protein